MTSSHDVGKRRMATGPTDAAEGIVGHFTFSPIAPVSHKQCKE
jgi:hypothetical protein